MKVYGLRINNVGVEFSTREDRERALIVFTKGSTVNISTSGVRYEDGETPFGTYERETNEVLVNCCKCHGVFSNEVAPHREYPEYKSWSDEKWSTETGHICDGCFASVNEKKKIADAKAVLNKTSTDECPI